MLYSFSGGESSGKGLEYVLSNKQDEFDITVAMLNTSKERPETMDFAKKVGEHFGVKINLLEATFDDKKSIGYRVTDFENYKRNGEVFEEMIKCYGLPNKAYPHCNRELKVIPIHRFAKDVLGTDYYTAIGIRVDEVSRINKDWKELKYYYPLIHEGMTKAHVNNFWNNMPFRLNLKGYEGNCNKCWKKSRRKLMTIELDERERGIIDSWWNDMEEKYGFYVPSHRKRDWNGEQITFYRENQSNKDIVKMSKEVFEKAKDDSIIYNFQTTLFGYDLDDTDGCEESCEVF